MMLGGARKRAWCCNPYFHWLWNSDILERCTELRGHLLNVKHNFYLLFCFLFPNLFDFFSEQKTEKQNILFHYLVKTEKQKGIFLVRLGCGHRTQLQTDTPRFQRHYFTKIGRDLKCAEATDASLGVPSCFKIPDESTLKKLQACIVAASGCHCCFPRKSSTFQSPHRPEDFFFCVFKTRAHSSSSRSYTHFSERTPNSCWAPRATKVRYCSKVQER